MLKCKLCKKKFKSSNEVYVGGAPPAWLLLSRFYHKTCYKNHYKNTSFNNPFGIVSLKFGLVFNIIKPITIILLYYIIFVAVKPSPMYTLIASILLIVYILNTLIWLKFLLDAKILTNQRDNYFFFSFSSSTTSASTTFSFLPFFSSFGVAWACCCA